MANIKIQKHLIINYISGNKKLPLIGQFLLHHEYSNSRCHDIAEKLLKLALNTNRSINQQL
jgi:hypothetical protein